MLTANNSTETESQETLNKNMICRKLSCCCARQSFVQKNFKAMESLLVPSSSTLTVTPSRQNLLMVAWGQAVKIAYTMSPCLFWQDFFPWLLWLGFFQALTQGLFPFLSLPIFSQTIMMNTCNWNENIQDVYAITTSYILWRKTLQKSFVLIHHNWLLKIWWLKKFSSEKCFCK